MNQFNRALFIGFLVFGPLVTAEARAQFEIVKFSIDNGAGNAMGGDFELDGTSGQSDAGTNSTGGEFSVTGGIQSTTAILLGDVNGDGTVNLLDVAPFVEVLTSGGFILEADINGDGAVNLLDVSPFVDLLTMG